MAGYLRPPAGRRKAGAETRNVATFALLWLLCAPAVYATDVVLALETSPGMESHLAAVAVPPMAPGDRMAVVRFSGKPKLAQKLTADRQAVVRAVRRLGVVRIGPKLPSDARVWLAIEQACKLLPNGGEIRLLFGSEDLVPVPDAVRQCLGGRVRLYAAAVRRTAAQRVEWRTVQTPPTIPGRYPPVPEKLMPPPEATMREIESLGGQKWRAGFSPRGASAPHQPHTAKQRG